MGRIDEALRRTNELTDETPATVPSQSHFVPAWQVVSGGRDSSAGPVLATESLAERPASTVPSTGVLAFSTKWRERLAYGPDGDPHLVEQFRRLAATLHQAKRANGLRTVMVSSAQPGDGKTLTAINLSLVMAESYRYNVLLIDADLRRPSIPSVVDLGEGTGLSEGLRAATEQKLALVPLTPRLTLLPAGQPIANSIEALTSPRMRQILEEASGRFDWIILDAPPIGPTADARLLAQMVDGTLFVIHAGRTQYQDVQKAVDGLGRDHILGVVFNGVESGEAQEYYGVPRTDDKA